MTRLVREPYLTGCPVVASVTLATDTSQIVWVAENSTCGSSGGGRVVRAERTVEWTGEVAWGC